MDPVNELRQAAIDAAATVQIEEKALNALLDDEAAARKSYRALLKKESGGKLSEDEQAERQMAEEALEGFQSRLSAQRKLVAEAKGAKTAADAELKEEEARLAVETARAIEIPSGRIDAAAPNSEEAPHGGFESFGHRLQAVAEAGSSRGAPDHRLLAGPTGLGETVASDGGFIVGVDQGRTIMERVYDVGNILGRVTRIPITTDANGTKLPAIDETSRVDGSRFGGIRGYWVEEAGSITASAPKLRVNSLTLKKVAALVYVTDEMLQDAGQLQAWIMQHLPDELVFKIEDAIVNGDGVGKPLGWKNSDAVVSVAKESGQAATTFVYKNAVKMWSRMWARSRATSIWLINQDVEPQLYQMTLPVGTGGSAVFLPAGGASASPFASLFGRPIVPAEYCATLGSVGDVQLVDPSQYTLIDKGGVQIASSMHVQFLTDQMCFRFLMRVDGLPNWNSPLTPKSGSTNTLSPFVTLAVRA